MLIDSTIVRSHACAAGAKKKHGEQSLGRSRGGFSTKIHLATDALGNTIRFILTAGQRNDITQAEALIENLFADAFVLKLKETGAEVVIPPASQSQTATGD